ncbi:MAG: nucleotidyltransferase domain-containing protein [Anaerolineae bacterium]|nr:nucleotidyltransferase domain-containing protein [Phycisphaerae bacterium]
MNRASPIPVPIDQIEAFCRKYRVAELSLFGSALRDDFGPASDVDVLIALAPGETMSLEKYLDMRDELSALFGGREIDLVQKRLLKNPFRRHEILTTRQVLYAA